MNVDKSSRADRVEGVIRGVLGFVLLAAALWALAHGSADTPGLGLYSLPGW